LKVPQIDFTEKEDDKDWPVSVTELLEEYSRETAISEIAM
jgi:hypothetical protein